MLERQGGAATAENAWNNLLNDSPDWRVKKNKSGSLQATHCYYNRQVTGEDAKHYLRYFHEKYVSDKAALTVASFGSGSGFLEPVLYQHGFQGARIVGYELNPVLVSSANEKAARSGLDKLEYRVADLNRPDLPVCVFDVGIFFHSLHHVENLEECLKTVAKAIRGDGYLLVVEFVGENFQQWTDAQIEQASRILALLPDKYKALPDGSLKISPNRPSVEEVIFNDPSESIRSKDILGVLDRYFDRMELVSLGGSVLNHVFEGIASNFDESDPVDADLIRCLQSLEQWFERSGIVSTDFVFGVYSPRATVLVSSSGDAESSSYSGISSVEPGWRWTEATSVTISVKEDLPKRLVLVIDYAGCYAPVAGSCVKVSIADRALQFVASPDGGCLELCFDMAQACRTIVIDIPDAVSPYSRKESADSRVLGLRILSVSIRVVSI